jgi:hypothetical protein
MDLIIRSKANVGIINPINVQKFSKSGLIKT